jgi:hypothetical protein
MFSLVRLLDPRHGGERDQLSGRNAPQLARQAVQVM